MELFDPQHDTLGNAKHLSLTLPVDLTAALLTKVPAAYHAGINDVLLTGLDGGGGGLLAARTPGGGGGGGTTTSRSCSISKATGRETDPPLTWICRAPVGWFTSVFPVRLEAARPDQPGRGAAGGGAAWDER